LVLREESRSLRTPRREGKPAKGQRQSGGGESHGGVGGRTELILSKEKWKKESRLAEGRERTTAMRQAKTGLGDRVGRENMKHNGPAESGKIVSSA